MRALIKQQTNINVICDSCQYEIVDLLLGGANRQSNGEMRGGGWLSGYTTERGSSVSLCCHQKHSFIEVVLYRGLLHRRISL